MKHFVLEILENNTTLHAYSNKDLNIIFNAIKNNNYFKNNYSFKNNNSFKNYKYILQLWNKDGNITNIFETYNITDILNLDIYYILEVYKNEQLIHAYGSRLMSNLNQISSRYKEESYSITTKINSEFFELINTNRKDIINKCIR